MLNVHSVNNPSAHASSHKATLMVLSDVLSTSDIGSQPVNQLTNPSHSMMMIHVHLVLLTTKLVFVPTTIPFDPTSPVLKKVERVPIPETVLWALALVSWVLLLADGHTPPQPLWPTTKTLDSPRSELTSPKVVNTHHSDSNSLTKATASTEPAIGLLQTLATIAVLFTPWLLAPSPLPFSLSSLPSCPNCSK